MIVKIWIYEKGNEGKRDNELIIFDSIRYFNIWNDEKRAFHITIWYFEMKNFTPPPSF